MKISASILFSNFDPFFVPVLLIIRLSLGYQTAAVYFVVLRIITFIRYIHVYRQEI